MIGHSSCKKQYILSLIVIFGLVVTGSIWGTSGVYASSGVDTRSSASMRSCSDTSDCSGGFKSTDFQSGSGKSVSYSQSASTGSEYYMTFSHNIRSQYMNPYKYKVVRTLNGSSGFTDSSSFTISGEKSSYSNGGTGSTVTGTAVTDSTSETQTSSGTKYYVANGKYTDGSTSSSCTTCRNYVLRDFYKITFKAAGTYKFCETISITEGFAEGTSTGAFITFSVSGSSGGGSSGGSSSKITVTVKSYDKTNKEFFSSYYSNSETASSGSLCAADVKDWGDISGYTLKGYTTSTSSTSYKTNPCSSSTTTYYAIYEEKELANYTLSAYAVDENGNSNPPGDGDRMDYDTVTEGSSATVTRSPYTGWTFVCWKKNISKSCASSTTNYTVSSLNSNTTIYAVYKKNIVNYTLTAYAVDESGGSNTPAGDSAIASKTVAENYSATVSKVDYDNWAFVCWKTSKTGSCVSDNTSYKVSSMTSNATVYAVYREAPKFYGKSDVTMSGTSSTTGWSDTSYGARASNTCSPTEGCKISFKHHLKKTGNGSTTYRISRTSNYIEKITNSENVKTGTFSGTDETVYTSDTFTIYPGMIVCEIVWFYSGGGTGTNQDTYVRVCASALGDAQPADPADLEAPGTVDPDDPTVSDAFLDIKVKNNTLETNYKKEVYAKPNDTVTYRATYNPILQYTYSLIPEKIQLNSGEIIPSSGTNTSFMWQLFTDWNNGFAVGAAGEGSNNFSLGYIYEKGSTALRKETNDYKIVDSDVGHDVKEEAQFNTEIKTKLNESTKTTPTQVTFYRAGSSTVNIGNLITTPKSPTPSASVKVPYNFDTEVKINTGEDEVVYSGEDTSIAYDLIVKERENKTLNGTYTTRVDEAKWKLIVYMGEEKDENKSWLGDDDSLCEWFGLSKGENCKYSEEKSGSLNPGTTSQTLAHIPVLDVSAGSSVCFAVAMYPSSSGSDLNMSKSGSNTWHISRSICLPVAKRPSIQIWGGNVFTNGNIYLNVAKKEHLAGFEDGKYNFGSWTELGLVANGAVTGLASGAGLGYAFNDNGDLSPDYHPNDRAGNNGKRLTDPGGMIGIFDYCNISTLSFANSDCNNSVGFDSANSEVADRSEMISKLEKNIAEEDITFTSTVSEMTLEEGTKLFRSEGDIMIEGNIEYTGNYESLGGVPKIFIYARNINIKCNVTRVDAALIAEEVVNTCVDDDGNTPYLNSNLRSKQLVINGTIIANKLLANRTYGAATGANSIIPAEIINYDSTLYLWGQNNTESLDSGSLEVTYQTELAPRY